MITIQQDTSDTSGIEMMANKNGPIVLQIDWDAVDNDADKLKKKSKNTLSKYDKYNLASVRKRVENFINMSNDDMEIELTWKLEDYILKSSPVQIDNIPEYSIDMIDYISISEGKLVRLSYYQMVQAIAFDMMYRDIDEKLTLKYMNQQLEDVGITGVYPIEMLLKHCPDDAFLLSKQLRVGNSPYKEMDTRNMLDYFSRKRFNGKYYRDSVSYSARYAYTVLAKSVLNKLIKSGEECRLISVSDSGICFATQCEDSKIQNLLGESVVIRAFGRRFEVKPKLIIF